MIVNLMRYYHCFKCHDHTRLGSVSCCRMPIPSTFTLLLCWLLIYFIIIIIVYVCMKLGHSYGTKIELSRALNRELQPLSFLVSYSRVSSKHESNSPPFPSNLFLQLLNKIIHKFSIPSTPFLGQWQPLKKFKVSLKFQFEPTRKVIEQGQYHPVSTHLM